MMMVLGCIPRKILQEGMRYTPGYDLIQKMLDRDQKIVRDNFGIKRKSTGYIYLPGSKFREAEGHLTIRYFYNMLLLIMSLGLENISTNMNFTDSALLEE